MEETHNALAEETMMPFANKNDAPRIQMFTNHLNQCVVLKDPDIPKVFTRFENQVGQYSSGYKTVKKECTIKAVIPQSKGYYSIITVDDDGIFDIVNITTSVNLTESYGYLNKSPEVDFFNVGDRLGENIILNQATCFDDYNSLMYGKNLKFIFYPWKGMTFEDAVVISESAAKKLSHVKVHEYLIPVNSNDILLNLYGNDEEYKCFPDIGEEVQHGVLCARRRIVNSMMLTTLNDSTLKDFNSTDDVFYSKGYVDSVYVYCNRPQNDQHDIYMKQIIKYTEAQEAYDKLLVETLKEAAEQGKLTSDAAYYFNRSRDSVNGRKWIAENSFDNLVIKIRVIEECPCVVGSKITNRCGLKGVVSVIVPDDQMPETEDGRRPDICLNYGGVPNRLNWGTMFESEINFIANETIRRHKDDPIEKKEEVIMNLLCGFNFDQEQHFFEYLETLSDEDRAATINEIFEKEFLPIHQPPFYGNIDIDILGDMYNEFDVHPLKFKGIEQPMVLGEMYFMKLKHEPSGKLSARSVGNVNIKGVPNKSNRNFRAGMAPYSKTPVRLGEQELLYLLLLNDPNTHMQLINSHSANKEDREALINKLLTRASNEPVEIAEGEYSTVKEILKAYLGAIGLKLEK